MLLHLAFGDHQVANVATEIEARTIGASIHQPAIAPLPALRRDPVLRHPRHPELPVLRLGADRLGQRRGDAADHEHGAAVGADPHSDPRNSAVARQQKSDFLQTGGFVTDVCSGLPCTAP